MAITVLLSYDLGASGDYDGLYRWLDDHDARECGSSAALFKFPCDQNAAEDEVFSSLKSELNSSVSINKSTRFYAVFFFGSKARGRFVIGRRKSSPWEGYGSVCDETIDEFGDTI